MPSKAAQEIQGVIDALGLNGSDLLSVGTRTYAGEFRGGNIKASELTEYALLPDGSGDLTRDVYACWNVFDEKAAYRSGRGGAGDVTRMTAIYADLDVKDGGFNSIQEAEDFLHEVSVELGANPTVIIYSGGGIQPIWPIEDAEDATADQADLLLRKFGAAIQHMASRFDIKLDSVFDLSRILRVPGTYNLKYTPPRQVKTVIEDNTLPGPAYRPLAMREIEDFFGNFDLKPLNGRNFNEDIVSIASEWDFADETCSYVRGMIEGYPTDIPQSGRHAWAYSQCNRLAAAHRSGCITKTDLADGVRAVRERLKVMRHQGIAGDRGVVPPDEVENAFRDAVKNIQRKSDEETADELGQHNHPDIPSEAERAEDEELFAAVNKAAQEANTAKPQQVMVEPQSKEETDFWQSRKVTRFIEQQAILGKVSRWGLLAAYMARVAADHGGAFQLPAVSGTSQGKGNLNLFVALYGPPAVGKTQTITISEGFIPFPEYETASMTGSGEGLMFQFGEYDKKAHCFVVRPKPQVLFVGDEVSAFEAVASRTGNTLMPLLTSGFSGSTLQLTYKDKANQAKVPGGLYRMCVIVNVQPGKAKAIMEHSDSGFAQRFLWMDMIDKSRPMQVTGDKIMPEEMIRSRTPMSNFKYCDQIEKIIAWDLELASRGLSVNRTGSDGAHDNYIRAKVAAIFALLEGRSEIQMEDWDLAGVMLRHSHGVQKKIAEVFDEESVSRAQTSGKYEGVRKSTSEIFASNHYIKTNKERIEAIIIRHLWRHQDTLPATPEDLMRKTHYCSRRHLVRSGRSTDKKYLLEFVSDLEDRGYIIQKDGKQGGALYKLAEGFTQEALEKEFNTDLSHLPIYPKPKNKKKKNEPVEEDD